MMKARTRAAASRQPLRCLAAALALALLPSPAAAYAEMEGINSSDKDEFCAAWSVMAEGAMRARQNGVPVTVALSDADAKSLGHADAWRIMVRDAYAQPAWHSEELQQRAVTDFGAMAYVACQQGIEDAQ